MYVNLLPISYVRRLTIRRQAWRWGLAITLTSLILSAVVAAQYTSVLAAQRGQTITALQSKDLHAIQADTQRITGELKSMESTITALQKGRTEDRTLALVGIASLSAKKVSDELHLKQVTTQITAGGAGQAPAPPPPGALNRKPPEAAAAAASANDFMIEGSADSATAIARFVDALRETGVFSRVELTSTSETVTATGATRQFRVDCKFQ